MQRLLNFIKDSLHDFMIEDLTIQDRTITYKNKDPFMIRIVTVHIRDSYSSL